MSIYIEEGGTICSACRAHIRTCVVVDSGREKIDFCFSCAKEIGEQIKEVIEDSADDA